MDKKTLQVGTKMGVKGSLQPVVGSAMMQFGSYIKSRGGADKYVGEVASGYDDKRESSDKWKVEQRIIEEMLSQIPQGDWILDCPIGTGRFLEAYQANGHIVVGIDKSQDMLQEAAKRAQSIGLTPQTVKLGQGNIFQLPLRDKSVDCSVMCRLTRWLSAEECQQAMKELQRVTRKRIIWTTRIKHKTRPDVERPIELYESVLNGWKIIRNEAGYEEGYRIVMAEPV